MNLLEMQEGLIFRLEAKMLHLEHSGAPKMRSWSVFDISGTEKCNGKFSPHEQNSIDISSLNPGVYEVCLMDEEILRSAIFKLV